MTEKDLIIQDLRRENENLRAELEWKQKEIELARRHARQWISVEDRLPGEFVSVLGHIADAGYFPSIRECYRVGNRFFFPALKDIHPIDFWADMPEPPKGE